MSVFRVTQTTLRGQFANDDCFQKWLEKQEGAALVTLRDDPMNDGGPNDRRYYLWRQDAVIDAKDLKCASSPDLISAGGKNAWDTQAEAQAVIDGKYAESAKIKAQVDKAKAFDAGKAAGDLVNDVGKAAEKAVTSPAVGTALKIAGGFGALFFGLWLVKLFAGRRG